MNIDLKDTVLGIELGSTRIKAVLINKEHIPVAQGSFEWENQLVDGVWTYSMEMIQKGIRECYKELKKDIKEKFGLVPNEFGAIGVSAMMHGYFPFDEKGNQLCEFRTWRNTMTERASEDLTTLFSFHIPQRWSIAHLYQAVLNGEEHIGRIARLTTLAGEIQFLLTGINCVGIGEASGIFPVDEETLQYDETMLMKFDSLMKEKQPEIGWTIRDILPDIKTAGESAGSLTEEGAIFLDPEGDLKAGVPCCPCEGDAETGMTATNSIRKRTGNVSAGTSDFAMVVLEKKLAVHREIDIVMTPDGLPVAMVHCSNCTSDINAWVELFSEFAESINAPQEKGKLFTMLFNKALEGEKNCGGLLSYNYYSGEGVTHMNEGRPVFLRTPDAKMNLANFMRMHLMSALSTLKWGLDILTVEENVSIDRLYGHGGYFKTPGVGQRMLSAAVKAPVSVMETAGEGGPYGMALLAAYMLWKNEGEALPDYLDNKVFNTARSSTIMADEEDIKGFDLFLEQYKKSFSVEKEAIKTF